MTLEKLLEFLTPEEPLPNKFTIYMGEKIRDGRIEAGMSQQELAKLIYKRQAALSDYENGKTMVDADTLALLAHNLNKPIEYFYPPYSFTNLKPEDLSPMEKEIITNLRYHVPSDQFSKLIVGIIKAIGEFDVEGFVIEKAEYVKTKIEIEREMKSRQEKRKKK